MVLYTKTAFVVLSFMHDVDKAAGFVSFAIVQVDALGVEVGPTTLDAPNNTAAL